MQASIRHQVNQLNFSTAEAQQFWKHMHFATASVADVGHWIPGLLNQWTSPHKIVSVTPQQGTAEVPVQICHVQQGTSYRDTPPNPKDEKHITLLCRRTLADS